MSYAGLRQEKMVAETIRNLQARYGPPAMLRVTAIRLLRLGRSLPRGILDIQPLPPRDALDRVGKPLCEANLLRIVVLLAESLVMDVPARHDVVLGWRDRKELTEGFSVLLDEAVRLLAIRSYAVADRIDHPAFDVMESLGVATPVGGLPRSSALSRFTPVVSVTITGSSELSVGDRVLSGGCG